MRQDGLSNANPHNTNENIGEGSINQISTPWNKPSYRTLSIIQERRQGVVTRCASRCLEI